MPNDTDALCLAFRRMRHSHAVGLKMFKMVMNEPDICRASAHDMYVLGLLHDIGYQFTPNNVEHAQYGGTLLKRQGYKYWQEVFYHGVIQYVFDSPELRLLNYADMLVGPDGQDMTMQERIADLSKRYGSGSPEEQDGIEMARFYGEAA